MNNRELTPQEREKVEKMLYPTYGRTMGRLILPLAGAGLGYRIANSSEIHDLPARKKAGILTASSIGGAGLGFALSKVLERIDRKRMEQYVLSQRNHKQLDSDNLNAM